MLYEYACDACGVFEANYKMGAAPKEVECPKCGKKCEKHFGGLSFILKGGDWPSRSLKMKNEQTQKNERAGRRQRGSHKSMKSTALDYGGGDIREI